MACFSWCCVRVLDSVWEQDQTQLEPTRISTTTSTKKDDDVQIIVATMLSEHPATPPPRTPGVASVVVSEPEQMESEQMESDSPPTRTSPPPVSPPISPPISPHTSPPVSPTISPRISPRISPEPDAARRRAKSYTNALHTNSRHFRRNYRAASGVSFHARVGGRGVPSRAIVGRGSAREGETRGRR